MTLLDRTYPDIVRDILTNLTHGITGEVQRIAEYDPTARPVEVPPVTLARRPVRRVSFVAGMLESAEPGMPRTPYTFTLNDYELVPTEGQPGDLSTIRFLPFGRKPAPGSDLIVNYYPRNAEPAPVDDVNTGSVLRTVVEAISRELAALYAGVNLAYDSAFVDTSTGSSLDRVVALLGLTRYRAGRPVGTVRFHRRAGVDGSIAIPPGTPVTDTADTLRYETVDPHLMLSGESTAEVRVRGATDGTPSVDPDVLTVLPRAMAGIEGVTNEQGTATSTRDETDDELRPRARGALAASGKGTVESITSGLLQMDEVRAVNVTEFPNGVAGELRVSISLKDGGDALPPEVAARIHRLRPAGVRVIADAAAAVDLQIRVALVLAGSHLPPSEIEAVHARVHDTLTTLVRGTGVGQRVRTARLVSSLLDDERVVDATLTLSAPGTSAGEPGTDYTPPAGAIADVGHIEFDPDVFDQQLAADAEEVPVGVVATVGANPVTGVPVVTMQGQIDARVRDYFAALRVPATVDAAGLLTALRDDAKYAIDPLRLEVSLTAGDQFVEVAQGGPVFTVLPGHVFIVRKVTVIAGGGK